MSKRSSSSRSTGHHWVVLGVFSVLSIAGNALHAFESGAGSLDPWVSAAIATIAPITLLASTHSLIIHRRDFNGPTRGVAMAITFLIASASFVLSFSALWELSTMAGIPSDRSWLMAVIIDAMVIQATMSLVLSDVADKEDSSSMGTITDQLLSRHDDPVEADAVGAHRPLLTSDNGFQPKETDEPLVDVSAAVMLDATEMAAPDERPSNDRDPGADLMTLASKVRESSNAVLSKEAIAQALQLRLEGQSLREIARAVSVRSHSTIGDWVRVAAKFDTRFDSSSASEDVNEVSKAQRVRV